MIGESLAGEGVNLTFGAAQAGVASAVADGIVPAREARDLLRVAVAYVNPQADDEDVVLENNRRLVRGGIRVAVEGASSVEEVFVPAGSPSDAFFGGSG